mmetsp:Transcript_26156/g.38687  ORF Transcript_26156/g.38687 Transcript_26156/m.38687 type:complete len:170 (+) Transcript_26156:85-594(+)
MVSLSYFLTLSVILLQILSEISAFAPSSLSLVTKNLRSQQQCRVPTFLSMAQVSKKEAKSGIDKVVKALQNSGPAKKELGRLNKVTTVLGYGSPSPGTLAVRFNASFRKGGMGRSAIPLPFGLGQSNESEGRGTMVGQVKAAIDTKTGKVTSCSVFRDLGYGRAFNLKL